MKRVFAFSVVLTLIFAVLGAHVSAAQTVPVDIWVDIKNGGTAVIITEVNSPLPDRSSMTLDDGQSEAFHIDFSEAGNFAYTIRIEPDDREITFDDTVYRINIIVTEEGGKLYTSIVIYDQKTGSKYSPHGFDEPCTVAFVNGFTPFTPDETTAPTQSGESETVSETISGTVSETVTATDQAPRSTKSDSKDDGKGSPKGSDVKSRPQTGDDSRLDLYLLLAIIASAGLFMLSVFYYRSVVKEIQKR